LDKILPTPISYIPFALVVYGLYKIHQTLYGYKETNKLAIVLVVMLVLGIIINALVGR